LGNHWTCTGDVANEEGVEVLFANCLLDEHFYVNLYQTFNAIAVLDLTLGTGEAAKAALSSRVPYFGVAISEEHATRLELELTKFVGRCMRTPGHALHDAAAPGQPENRGPPGGKPGGKPGGTPAGSTGKDNSSEKGPEEKAPRRAQRGSKKRSKTVTDEDDGDVSEDVDSAMKPTKGGKKGKKEQRDDHETTTKKGRKRGREHHESSEEDSDEE